ncbi:MAG: hypothetical protein EOP60_11675 [Sphingomonadales bacterium]|nr:MAG: hypothetical protein EOP60_11675 [Sphingomonadales bacterium]
MLGFSAAARFYRRHRPAICRGFLVALAVTIAALWFVQPVILVHRFNTTDAVPFDSAYVGRLIVNDARAGAPGVLVIGGSSIRDLIPGSANLRMSGLCGHDTDLLNAATSAQHPADSRAIADALRTPPALVVIGMTYRRFSSSRWNDPFALEQARVELPRSSHAFIEALFDARLDAGIFDSLAQLRRMDWERQLVDAAWRGAPVVRDPHARHVFDMVHETVASPAEKQFRADRMWVVGGDELASSIDAMTAFWIDFARDMRRRGSRTIFVMTPTSGEAATIARAYAAPVARAIATIGREFPFIDMRGLRIAEGEFRDPLHLTGAGRDRVWPWLSATIARHGGCGEG